MVLERLDWLVGLVQGELVMTEKPSDWTLRDMVEQAGEPPVPPAPELENDMIYRALLSDAKRSFRNLRAYVAGMSGK